jgi:hypothetical protein
MASFAAFLAPQAKAASETIVGIHVRLQGTQPHATQSLEMTHNRLKQTCAKSGVTYQLVGNLKDVGSFETDMYYAPSLGFQARRIKTHTLLNTAYCKYEIAPTEKWKIRHFNPGGHTDFESKNAQKNGAYWLRSTHKAVNPKATASLLMDSMLSEATVSPVIGTTSHAGHPCKVRNVSLGKGVDNTLCVAATGLPFPAEVVLANKSIWGGTLMMEEAATMVNMKAVLPVAYFHPTKDKKIVDLNAASKSGDNPTQK